MLTFTQDHKTKQYAQSPNNKRPSHIFARHHHNVVDILHLHRMTGIQGVQRLLHSKQTVNFPGENNEHEADYVANAVTQMPESEGQNAVAQVDPEVKEMAQIRGWKRPAVAPKKDSMVNRIWKYFKRSGCNPGFKTALIKQTGSGCNAKALIYISYIQCVPKSKCSDKDQLRHVRDFGKAVCQLFCYEKNCLKSSYFQPPNKCWPLGVGLCLKPGIENNPCPEACPYFAQCANDAFEDNASWNCHCSASSLPIV